MTSTIPGKPDLDKIDLSSREFWATTADQRERSFAILREQRPVSWHRPVEAPTPDAGRGGTGILGGCHPR